MMRPFLIRWLMVTMWTVLISAVASPSIAQQQDVEMPIPIQPISAMQPSAPSATVFRTFLYEDTIRCFTSEMGCNGISYRYAISDVIPTGEFVRVASVRTPLGSCELLTSLIVECSFPPRPYEFEFDVEFVLEHSRNATEFTVRISSTSDTGSVFTSDDVDINFNYLSNGEFGGTLNQWSFYGDIERSLRDGVLYFHRQAPGWKGAIVSQSINRSFDVNTPLQIALQLGNTSDVPKGVEILLRDSNYNQIISCAVTIPPNTPLRTFRMRANVEAAWVGTTFAIRALDQDDAPSILVDNVSVRLSTFPISRLLCDDLPPPDNTDLMNNGNFSRGLPYWVLFGDYEFRIVSGIMTFYRATDAVNQQAAVLFQQVPYHIRPSSELRLFLRLGNASSQPRSVEVFLRDAYWSQFFRCEYTLPANTSLTYVRVQGLTDVQWSSPLVVIRDTTTLDQPNVLVDDVLLTTLYAPVDASPPLDLQGSQCGSPNFSSGALMIPEDMKAPVTILPDGGLLPDTDGAAPLPVTPPNPQPEGIPAIPGF